MTNPLSILQKATKASVRHEPFPYIVIQDALPSDIYEQLAASYPPLSALEVEQGANNHRWSFPTLKALASPEIPDIWKKFVAYHASQEFFQEIVDLFHEDVTRLYPRQFPNYESLRKLTVGTRVKGSKGKGQTDGHIYLDAQISGNTPVVSASSVRTTHVDDGRKLFSGLFYMRRDDDDSRGGDLTLSRFLPAYSSPREKLKTFDGVYVDDKYVEHIDTVKYAKNTVVLFVNSVDSLHGVTTRQPTRHPRIFLNLIGEINESLYDTSRSASGASRFTRRLAELIGVH